jgi:iron(III) transport system permease protein
MSIAAVQTVARPVLLGSAAWRALALIALMLVLCFLAVYPIAMLVYGSLHTTPPGSPGTFDLSGYGRVLTAANVKILWTTVEIAFVKTVLSLAVATALAWIVARTDTPWRGTLEVLITLPFFIPPILTAMAWGMLGNPQVGTINLMWRWVTGSDTTLVNVYSWSGVVWHMMQYSTTFIFLILVNAFRAMDPSLEEAARTSGASGPVTFRLVTLGLLLPSLTSCFLLSFIRGVEAFESALLFGLPAGINVMTTEIYNAINQRASPDYQYATALSMAIMVLMALLVVGQWAILRGRNFQTVTGKGYNPRVTELGRWRWVTFGACIAFFVVTVVLPVGQLLVGSFFRFFGFYQRSMLTLENYRAVFNSTEFWRAAKNTLLLGAGGASATMVFGGILAYVIVRTTWRGRRLIEVMAWLPWMVPGIVLGLGFLWAFAMLPMSIPIYGTFWALFFAYVTLGTPLAVRIMSGAYGQISADLEECARVHGANWWQTLWRILIVLSWPAFAVGWTLTFFGIVRELSASILLYSIGSEVLSVQLVRLWSDGRPEQVSVVALMMIVLVVTFRLVQVRLIGSGLARI